MKHSCLFILACLVLTSCQQSAPTLTPDNNGTIVAGVMQTLTAQVATPTQVNIEIAIAQTLTAIAIGTDAQLAPVAVPATLVATRAPEDTPLPASQPISAAEPQIVFTTVPPLGSSEDLAGKVAGINPNDYGVAVYIKVAGGWWTKPYFNASVTFINLDGTWNCDITTGGGDPSATVIRAYLIPIGFPPPTMDGGPNLPASLEKNAVAVVEATR